MKGKFFCFFPIYPYTTLVCTRLDCVLLPMGAIFCVVISLCSPTTFIKILSFNSL